MTDTCVYHVVTEKPMELGQMIIYDDHHHNGVYNRVGRMAVFLKGMRTMFLMEPKMLKKMKETQIIIGATNQINSVKSDWSKLC